MYKFDSHKMVVVRHEDVRFQCLMNWKIFKNEMMIEKLRLKFDVAVNLILWVQMFKKFESKR